MNKQKEILKYLAKVKKATLQEIVDNTPFFYYHNKKKYVGEILGRMVKSKRIKRTGKGIYEIGPGTTEVAAEGDFGQQNLFDQ